MRFSARCKLEVTEHRDGLVPEACAPAEGATKEQLSGLLPWPACTLPGVPCSDISFELVEGDFQVGQVQGDWMEQAWAYGCLNRAVSDLVGRQSLA